MYPNDIQPEITTKAKYFGKLTMGDMMAIAFIVMYGLKFSNQVYQPLSTLSLIFFVVIGLFWLLPHHTNKKMRNYQYLIQLLLRSRKTYHSIPSTSFETYQSVKERDII
ncbi:hypothetical protein JZO82_04170 [Vagococcus fluvialis]|uniref:DUF5592 family protein n=1 Tax=Vagococcus fluvialis TaxID=2738 RepID=UPI001A90B1AF|nr:DUF5592 family protein [Vagococcus fluvialis]MBO0428352.1 hypothetical protein [Vagococcus fluvialis]